MALLSLKKHGVAGRCVVQDLCTDRTAAASGWHCCCKETSKKRKKENTNPKLNTCEMFGWKFSIANSGCVEMETFHGTNRFAVNF